MRLRRVGSAGGVLATLTAGTLLAASAVTGAGASAVVEHDRPGAHDFRATAHRTDIADPHTPRRSGGQQARAKVLADYGRLPLAFEANVGQADRTVRYLTRGPGYTLFVTDTGAAMNLQNPSRPGTAGRPDAQARFLRRAAPTRGHWYRHSELGRSQAGASAPHSGESVLVFHPAKGSAPTQVTATDRLPGVVNYLIGKHPSAWHTRVPTFSQVRTGQVWPGVDLTWHGQNNAVEYDLTLAPGVDAAVPTFDVDGARALRIDPHGNLLITAAGGQAVTEHAPVAWQDVDGVHRPVEAAYRLLSAHRFGFTLGAHDRSRPVVIDPTIAYSTFLGAGSDVGVGVAVDGNGSAYVTGQTGSANFPCTAAGSPTGCASTSASTLKGTYDAFVTKLSPAGNQVLYSTYLGGTGDEDTDPFAVKGFAAAIAVDGTGNAYVTGSTNSIDFPTTAGAFQTGLKPRATLSAFLTELNPTGTAPVYSTYLGGSGIDEGLGIALDPGCTSACPAYLTGVVTSFNFPTQPTGAHLGGGGLQDAFVAKLPTAGAPFTPVYSTVLGGSKNDAGVGIAVDGTGDAYVTGSTESTDFLTNNQIQVPGGSADAFVAELNPAGGALVYSTYLGGSGADHGMGIALDLGCISACPAYVTGATGSTNFPTANPYEAHLGNGLGNASTVNAFVAKLTGAGTGLVYSTYLGGTVGDQGLGIAVDRTGTAYVTGMTTSADFPTLAAFQPQLGSGALANAFVTALGPAGSTLLYSSYLGGQVFDWGYGVAVDQAGAVYLTGFTWSAQFPTVNPFQAHLAGLSNAFVTKINALPHAVPPVALPEQPQRRHHHCWNNDPNPNTNSRC